jgi:hypothetical protein
MKRLKLSAGAAHATVFTGFTDGCYGAACVPVANVGLSSTTLGGLKYNDSTFSTSVCCYRR